MPELRRVANYDVLDRIGRGGMGAVFKARQIDMDRIVALKILPPSLAKKPTFIERFLREARASAKLNHPNIVNGIDVGSDKGLYYFAMEYVEGCSLKALIDRDERLNETRAISVTREIALALDHAHSHGIIHRDIKPENILIQNDGSAKLCDLGLAHLATESDEIDKNLTQAGRSVGTPHYISPEQARGGDLDATTDLYSLGATLYHMLTGVTLFQGSTAVSVMSKHLNEKAVDPSEFGAELSDGMLSILGKLLIKDRSRRYSSARKLVQDLERVSRGEAPRFAEVDAADWPFKGKPKPVGAKPGSDGHRIPELARKGASLASVEKADRGGRSVRRGRAQESEGVPAAALALASVFLVAFFLVAMHVFGAHAADRKAKSPAVAPVASGEAIPAAYAEEPSVKPAEPPRPEAIALPAPSENMQALANMHNPRAAGVGLVASLGTPDHEAPVLIRASLNEMSEGIAAARAKLSAGDFNAALEKIDALRREFSGSSEWSDHAADLEALAEQTRAAKLAKEQAAPQAANPLESHPSGSKPSEPKLINTVQVSPPADAKPAADLQKKAAPAARAPAPNKLEAASRAVDLLARGSANGGNPASFWMNMKKELICSSKSAAYDFQYRPPEEYDFKLSFKLDELPHGDHAGYVMMYLPVGERSLVWCMPYGMAKFYAFDNIDHRRYMSESNPTAVRGHALEAGQEYTAEIKVRRDSITASLNGMVLNCLRSDSGGITGDPDSKLNDAHDLGVGDVNRIGLRITGATVTELSSAARP